MDEIVNVELERQFLFEHRTERRRRLDTLNIAEKSSHVKQYNPSHD